MGYAGLGQNNHQHAQDLWLGVGVVGDLKGHPYRAEVLTGEGKSWEWRQTVLYIAATSLNMCGLSLGVCQIGLSSNTHWYL